MDLQIRVDDGTAVGTDQRLDDTFLVEFELSISVENNVIRYEAIPVAPYEKSYVG